MKYAILTALILAGGRCLAQQNTDAHGYVTNAALLEPFTFTNKNTVITDAVLVKLTANKFIYKKPDGGEGLLPLAVLPETMKKKVGFNPEAAAAADAAELVKKEREKLAYQQSKIDDANRAKTEAIWDMVNSHKNAFSGGNLNVSQVLKTGVLASYDHEDSISELSFHMLLFVKDCPPSESMFEGQPLPGSMYYDIGTYTYTTVMGASKTIKCVTCSPYAAFQYWSTNNSRRL